VAQILSEFVPFLSSDLAFRRDMSTHKVLFASEGGLEDGTKLAYYFKSQVRARAGMVAACVCRHLSYSPLLLLLHVRSPPFSPSPVRGSRLLQLGCCC